MSTSSLQQTEIRVIPVGPRPLDQRPLKRALTLGRLVRAVSRGSAAALVFFGLATGPFASDTIGLIKSYQTQGASSQQLPATAELVYEVALPRSPFVEAARWEDGSVDLREIVNLWSRAGLSTTQIYDVAKLHAALGPTWMGTQDLDQEAKFKRRAKDALATLRTNYPVAWQRLSDRDWVAKNAHRKTTPDNANLLRQLANEVQFPDFVEERTRTADDYDDATKARARIMQGMKVAGLRSLQLSYMAGHTAKGMMDTAIFLEQTNQRLVEFTGWKGPVMGLGGRIDVVIDGGGADHLAITTTALLLDRDIAQRPNVTIAGQPSSYFHEMGHALDFILAREAYRFNDKANSLSEAIVNLNESLWSGMKLRRNGDVEKVMQKVLDGLPQNAPSWQLAREEFAHRTGHSYWTNPTEGFGFALAGQFIAFDEDEPWRTPSPEETAKQKPLLVQFFKDLAPLNLTARPGLDNALSVSAEQLAKATPRTRVNVEGGATSVVARSGSEVKAGVGTYPGKR